MKTTMRVMSVRHFLSGQQELYHEFGGQRAWPGSQPPPPSHTELVMFEVAVTENDGHPAGNWTVVIPNPMDATVFKVGSRVVVTMEPVEEGP